MDHPESTQAQHAAAPRRTFDTDALRAWLKAPVTLTLPGWAFASGGLGLFALFLVALD